MTSGEKITMLRRKAGMSQELLADRLGISRQAVSKWEADLTAPSTDNLRELSRMFGVPVDALLQPENDLPESEICKPQATETESATMPPPIGEKILHAGQTKRRVFAVALLAVVAFGGLMICTIWQQVQINRMMEKIDQLMARGNQTVYLPSPENAQVTQEVTDYQMRLLDFDPKTQTAQLGVSVIPLHFSSETTATFSVKGKEHTTTEKATFEDGTFLVQLAVPIEAQMKLYFLMEENGETKTVFLEDLSGLLSDYMLTGSSDFMGELRLAQGGLEIRGDVQTQLNFTYRAMHDLNLYPVKGTVVLVVDGETIETKEIDGLKDLIDLAPEQQEDVLSGIGLFTSFDCIVPWKPGRSNGNFHTTLEDNFGQIYEFDSEFTF